MISTEISTDVSALVDALVGVSPGQLITYASLSATIGRDVQKVGWLLQSARRIAVREHGVVFGSERGVGLARLTTEQLPTVGATARDRIRRKAKTAQRAMIAASTRANDVSPETSRKINAELSVLGLIQEISKTKAAAPVAAHDARPEPVAVIAKRLFASEQAQDAA
jgi:hypothetical protein